MSLSEDWKPKNQAECDLNNARREYERALKVWMKTPVHTMAGVRAKEAKDAARVRHTLAYNAVYPKHIVM